MRNFCLKTFGFFIMFCFLGFNSCEEPIDDLPDNQNTTLISRKDSKDSHRTGENCTSCHKSGGTGKGWFTISGSVFDSLNLQPYPNAVIQLFTLPGGNGSMIAEVEGDSLGNFYTTQPVDFGIGLYPRVIGSAGTSISMGSHITKGSCNGCHGITTNRIKLK